MRKLSPYLFGLFIVMLMAPILLFAQEAAESAVAAVTAAADAVTPPTADDFTKFMAAIGGMKGAGTMGIVIVVVQGLLLALRSQLGSIAGKWRLVAVSLLTLVAGVIGLKVTGMDWMGALMNSASLAMFQVFFHQAKKQFIDKTD